MFIRGRSPLHALFATALILGAVGCESDSPTAATRDLKRGGTAAHPASCGLRCKLLAGLDLRPALC
jgi:hypothetical protein